MPFLMRVQIPGQTCDRRSVSHVEMGRERDLRPKSEHPQLNTAVMVLECASKLTVGQ